MAPAALIKSTLGKPHNLKRWLEAALSNATALHTFDDALFPLTNDAAALANAAAAREAWRHWYAEAKELVLPASRDASLADMYEKLHRELAMARFVERTPVELMQARRQSYLNGNWMTLEEAKQRAVQMANRR